MQILTRMWMKCIMKKMHCKYRLTNQFGWHIQRVRRGQFQSLEKLIGWSDWLTILSEYNIKERHRVQICHNLCLTTRHSWCDNFLQGCISSWPNCLFYGKTTTVYTSFDINLLSSSSLSHSPWTSVAKLVNNKLKTLRRSARASYKGQKWIKLKKIQNPHNHYWFTHDGCHLISAVVFKL